MVSRVSFFLLSISFLLLSACRNADPKVIARIDSTLVLLDSTNKIAASIQFEKEIENAKKIKSDLEFIQNNFTDTLTKDMGFVLSDYRGIVAEEAEEGGGNEQYEAMLKKELDYLGGALENPKRPFMAILGGSKISGKIDVIRQLLKKCDTILIGGGMMFTFY